MPSPFLSQSGVPRPPSQALYAFSLKLTQEMTHKIKLNYTSVK